MSSYGKRFNPLTQAIIGWLFSRPFFSLLKGIPALLVAGFLVFLSSSGGTRRIAERKDIYRALLADALARKDDATAAIAAKAMIELAPTDDANRFQLAIIELRQENNEASIQLLSDLVYQRKYTPAVLWWMQKRYPLPNIQTWDEAKHQEFRTLATIAISHSEGKERIYAKKLFINYLVNTKAFREAQVLLIEDANLQNPELLVPAAVVSNQVGDKELVKRFATEGRNHFRKTLSSSPMDLNARNAVAECSLLLSDWSEAIQVLEQGLVLKNDPRLEEMLVNTLAATVELLREESLTNRDVLLKRFSMVFRAIQMNPSSDSAMNALVRVVIDTRKNDEEQVETLRQALLKGITPEAAHFVQGTVLLLDGKYKEALVDLKAARTDDSRMGEILNNMAYAISNLPDGDLKEALRLATGAEEFLPGNPNVAETHGRILLKLKRYQEAIPFFEKALKLPEVKKAAYLGLSDAYKGLGQLDRAKQYRAEADKLEPEN